MKSYPSIEPFRKIKTNEIIDYYGTVKLHGTHSDIVKMDDKIILQSRNRILTIENDNLGFALFMSNININLLFEKINSTNIRLCGEFIGKGIQKGMAISKLPLMFVITDIIIDNKWVNMYDYSFIHDNSQNIYNIMQFKTFNITIDFNNKESVQDELDKLTNDVYIECPVGKYFNIHGKGEGIVWKPINIDKYSHRYFFKTKAEEFTVIQPKKITTDNDKKAILAEIEPFIENFVNDYRCKQAMDYMIEMNLHNIYEFIQWVNKDFWKEEKDTVENNSWIKYKREINKMINDNSRTWFNNYIKTSS
jgi:hypothetical protein